MSATRYLSRGFRTLAYTRRRFASAPKAAEAAAEAQPDPKVESILGLRIDSNTVPENVIRALSLENASRSEARRLRKIRLIETFRRSESDTGSPEVQIAILTDRIKDLTGHVQQHKQDKMNMRSLVMLVHKRRRLMKYLLRETPERYVAIVKALSLRPSSVFSKDVPLGAKKAPTPKLN
ncbi:unnamed protein product [Chondrus crispus]|uniref:30S ribosomal protein S15 n=1 Tax=Chondrus crispus TaxID=2769 RepID=R7QP79_CHOCR|nr:unnamed protein product [Chondrus crispus]CDF39291.1 unnamed protein product [Chondrus crispus]|eukprot:XP_005719202.1 unnamed protein product [Chondrus crispus]